MPGPLPEATVELVKAYQGGDVSARDRLIERCLPILRRWAHGRLPNYGRSLAETDDLVQVSMMRALNNLKRFDSRRPGALLSYLRTILMNAVREEIRRSKSHSMVSPFSRDLTDPTSSVVERVIGQQQIERYEAALLKLTEEQREAVILRIEFGMTYPEMARELAASSPDSVRMLVARGLVKLAELMR